MKKNKIPKIFRKQYKVKSFKSKILKRIYIPTDRTMIESLFKENTEGKMEISQDIPKDVHGRLKNLAKSIKKNKGFVTRWKAFIVVFLIVLILIFNLFFKDKLLTKAVESGLESVFKAEVNIDKLHLSLIKGQISYQSLIIANADKPSRNLLETGSAELKISISELMKKHVRIEEMSLTGVKWNTPRFQKPDGNKSPVILSKIVNAEDNINSSGMFDIFQPGPDELNYEALLDQQKRNLNSMNLINKANEETDALIKKWEDIYSEKGKEIKDIKADVSGLQSLSISDLNSAKEIKSKSTELKDIYSRVDKSKDGLLSLQSDFNEDRASLIELQNKIKGAVDDDYAYLDNLVDLSSGEMKSLASSIAESYIRKRWNTYYENGLQALKVYRRFRAGKAKESKKGKGLSRATGRDIPFPSSLQPSFLIDHILLSGNGDGVGTFNADINTISNEPDKLTEPLSFILKWAGEKSEIILDGTSNMRSDAVIPFSMKIQSDGNPVLLDKGVPVLNITRLSTVADIKGESKATKTRDVLSTDLDISLSNIKIEQNDAGGAVSRTIRDLLAGMNQIDLKAEILVNENGLEKIKVKSGLDSILSNSLGDYLNGLAGDMQTELKNRFTASIAPSLEKNKVLQSSISAIGVESLNQISSVEGLENILDKKQKELENRASSITSELQAGAQKAIDEKSAEAKAEADRAKAEADKKVQDQASKLIDKAADKIKLPGF